MKKILLFCVAILAVTQIYAAEYAIVGSFTNPTWDFSASRSANGVLVEKDGKYVTEIENLTSGFKIVDIENNNWDIQYGAPSGNDMVEIGKTFTLKAKDGGADPSNIEFANYVTAVQNAKVEFDPVAMTLTVTGTPVSDLKLYISGNMTNWVTPGEDGSIAMAENNGVYTATVNFSTGNEFKIFGKGWSPEFGLPSDDTPALSSDNLIITLAKSSKNIKVDLDGEYVVSFNLNTLELRLTSTSTNGISQMDAISETPEYYTLHGVKVSSPTNGVYIVKRGTVISKEIVK